MQDGGTRGLGPLQITCLIGGAVSILVALLAFEEPSIELVVLGMGFAVIILLDAIWRGITTGELPNRHGAISSSLQPVTFTGMLLFYLGCALAVLYFGVDLLLVEL